MDIIYVTPIMCNYFGILLIIFGLLFFIFWIVAFVIIDDADCFAIATIVCFIAGFIINGVFKTDYTGYNEYTARINDSVTFNEVIKDYDIIKIDRENNLVTLQNKEPQDNP